MEEWRRGKGKRVEEEREEKVEERKGERGGGKERGCRGWLDGVEERGEGDRLGEGRREGQTEPPRIIGLRAFHLYSHEYFIPR